MRKNKSREQQIAIERKREEKSAADISFDSDRAVTEFKAFYATAELHTHRVDNLFVIESYVEGFENLRNDLQTRKKMLLFQ